MKLLSISTILLMLIACFPLASEESEGSKLGVMSFNIRYGLAPDGDNAWSKRRDIVADCIKEYAPDVFGTQECLDFQAAYLDEVLKEYRYFGIGRDGDGTGEMTAVFFQWKVLLPVESGHFWLSETPEVPGSISWDSSLTRIASWVKFYHIPSKRYFYYYNTHFDHRGEQARLESAKLVKAHITALKTDLPVVVTGDFNAAAESSEPWKALVSGAIKDAWLEVENPVGPNTTWSGFTAPKPDQDRRIDWILYSGPVQPEHAETLTYNLDGRYPSDHFPVYARFHF